MKKKKIFRYAFMISLFSTIRIKLITKGRCFIMKRTSISFNKTAKIVVEKGQLIINDKWSLNDPFYSTLIMKKKAKLIVKDNFRIFSGSRISINEGATLVLGKGYINNNLNISCYKKIEIGNNVVISENVCIRDSDNHKIIGSNKPSSESIYIGNHVWVGMNVTILKGVRIGDGAIIAAGSLVNRSVAENSLAAGVPVKIIKKNVTWE